MINRNIDKIAEKDLQTLIDNKVLESKTIEYKQSLPGNSDSDKKEFLADVSSFANASGGNLIYGIVEEKGEPVNLIGLDIVDVDKEIARLNNIIITGIEPRIFGIDIHPVKLSNSKGAIVIRVPKSWINPHRVCFKRHAEFYTRSANGKYPMDVGELRVAFNLSETAAEKIRTFRENRIAKIYAGETPVPFYENAKIVLHIIPVISFNPGQRYNLKNLIDQRHNIKAIYSNNCITRYNFDGYLAHTIEINSRSHSYIQLYNNGIIEAVEGLLLDPEYNKGLIIPRIGYEEELINSLSSYLNLLKELNIEPPIFIFLSLLGVKGYKMENSRSFIDDDQPIDKDILLIPEVVIEDYNEKADHILKPCFDSIWNACGFPESLNYDEDGNWKAMGIR